MGINTPFDHFIIVIMISRNVDPFPCNVFKKTTDWFSQMFFKLLHSFLNEKTQNRKFKT